MVLPASELFAEDAALLEVAAPLLTNLVAVLVAFEQTEVEVMFRPGGGDTEARALASARGVALVEHLSTQGGIRLQRLRSGSHAATTEGAASTVEVTLRLPQVGDPTETAD